MFLKRVDHIVAKEAIEFLARLNLSEKVNPWKYLGSFFI
jgi:hypothetical protein